MAKVAGPPKRAVSPAWGRGKELLLEAARELFAAKGYAGVSTKEIAERASVTEPMLFRHFGSKARLFEEAVFAPFNEYISTYVADWEGRPHGTVGPVEEARNFYRGLYDVLFTNRKLIRALIAAQESQGPLAQTSTAVVPLGAVIERFERVILQEREDRGFRAYDPAIQARMMFGLVLSIAVHGDWMYDGASGSHPGAEPFIEEMAQMTIHGAYDRPGHPSWEDA